MVLVENPEGKRPLGRPRLRWGDVAKRVEGWLRLENKSS